MEASSIKFIFAHSFPCDCSYTKDGSSVVTCGSDCSVALYDSEGKHKLLLSLEDEEINCCTLNDSGLRLYLGTDTHSVISYSFPEASEKNTIYTLQQPIRCLALTKDEKLLAVGSDNSAIMLVIPFGSKCGELRGHTKPVTSLSFNKTDEYLVSTSADGNIKIWDIKSKTCCKTFTQYAPVVGIANEYKGQCSWSNNNKYLAIPKHNDIAIIEYKTWNELFVLSESANENIDIVAFSPNDLYLLSSSCNSTICVWDVENKKCIKTEDIDAKRCCQIQWNKKANEAVVMDIDGQYGIYKNIIDDNLPSPFLELTNLKPKPSSEKLNKLKKGSELKEKYIEDEALEDEDIPDDIEGETNNNNNNVNVNDDDIGPLEEDDNNEGSKNKSFKKSMSKKVDKQNDNDIEDEDDELIDDLDLVEAKERELEKKGELYDDEDNANGNAVILNCDNMMTAMQRPFQPSSTPVEENRRYLCWNYTGCIITRKEEKKNSISVTFNDVYKHKNFTISETEGYSYGTLTDNSAFFATSGRTDFDELSHKRKPISLYFRPLNSTTDEWYAVLNPDEETICIAAGNKWCAVAVNHNGSSIIRFFTHTGLQLIPILSPGSIISMVGYDSQLFIIYHSSLPTGEAQNISYQLIDVNTNYKIAEGSLNCSKTTIEWIGFSTIGYPVYYTSNGLLCTLVTSYGYQWVPILDTNDENCCKTAKLTHWLVSVTEDKCLCAVLHATALYPRTLKPPVLSTIPLHVPLLISSSTAEADQGYIQKLILLKHYQLIKRLGGFVDDETMNSLCKKIDKDLLVHLVEALNSEKIERCRDVSNHFTTEKSFEIANSLAMKGQLTSLAEELDEHRKIFNKYEGLDFIPEVNECIPDIAQKRKLEESDSLNTKNKRR